MYIRKKPRMLKNIRIQEISLVDVPANKRKFLFFKRDNSSDKGGGNMEDFEKRGAIGVVTMVEKTMSKLDGIMQSYEGVDEIEKDAADSKALTELAKIGTGVLRFVVNKASKPEDWKDYDVDKQEDYKSFMQQCLADGGNIKSCSMEWNKQNAGKGGEKPPEEEETKRKSAELEKAQGEITSLKKKIEELERACADKEKKVKKSDDEELFDSLTEEEKKKIEDDLKTISEKLAS